MKTSTLTINETFVDKATELLSVAFGKEIFETKKTGPVTERINSYEAACEDQGKKVLSLDDFKMIDDEIERKATFAHHQAQTIVKSWNEGWKPKFDGSQRNYYIWGEYNNGSGFGFSSTAYSYSRTGTNVGVRLWFKTDSLGKEFIKQFPNLLSDIVTF